MSPCNIDRWDIFRDNLRIQLIDCWAFPYHLGDPWWGTWVSSCMSTWVKSIPRCWVVSSDGSDLRFRHWRRLQRRKKKFKAQDDGEMGMDQYLLIPFLGGWTSIYQLFWCSPGVQGFDSLPDNILYIFGIDWNRQSDYSSTWTSRILVILAYVRYGFWGSILGALKAIVNVIGMTKMTPPIKERMVGQSFWSKIEPELDWKIVSSWTGGYRSSNNRKD